MEVVKEFNLTDKQIHDIQMISARLTALKNILKEFTPSDSAEAFDLLVEQMAQAQFDYNVWFQDIQDTLDVQTVPQNKWNLDYNNKKLQLLLA